MGDLFQVKRENKSHEELILEEIFGDREKKWQHREAEASAYMTEYIDEHHEMLDRAVITIEELCGELRSMMTDLRRQHIADNEPCPTNQSDRARIPDTRSLQKVVIARSIQSWSTATTIATSVILCRASATVGHGSVSAKPTLTSIRCARNA